MFFSNYHFKKFFRSSAGFSKESSGVALIDKDYSAISEKYSKTIFIFVFFNS